MSVVFCCLCAIPVCFGGHYYSLFLLHHGYSLLITFCFSKKNVDGSFKGKTRPMGIDGVLRDNTTTVKLVFSKSIGVANSNVAELLAVREALSVYATSRWASSHRLIIECDSSNVVK